MLDLHINSAPGTKGGAPAEAVPADAAGIVVASRISASRPELEAFIRAGFERSHRAAIQSFMPVLIGLRDASGRLIGAAGYRTGEREPLFLEQYLDDPIEGVIASLYPKEQPARREIAEIGNFVCTDGGTAMRLIPILAGFLLDQGHRWVVFTATRTVRRITSQMGISLRDIARADPARLAGHGDDWGAYYATDPRVMLGFVPSWRDAADRSRSC